jgi:hypothetical protein
MVEGMTSDGRWNAVLLGAVLGALLFLAVYQPWLPYSARERAMTSTILWTGAAVLFVGPLFLAVIFGRPLLIGTAVWAGIAASNAALIIYDVSADPTNHNLWPFEFVIIGFMSLLGFAGAGLGTLVRRATKS